MRSRASRTSGRLRMPGSQLLLPALGRCLTAHESAGHAGVEGDCRGRRGCVTFSGGHSSDGAVVRADRRGLVPARSRRSRKRCTSCGRCSLCGAAPAPVGDSIEPRGLAAAAPATADRRSAAVKSWRRGRSRSATPRSMTRRHAGVALEPHGRASVGARICRLGRRPAIVERCTSCSPSEGSTCSM